MRVPTAILVGGLASFAAAGSPRQDPQQTPPVFRSGVDVVQVDVSVLDRAKRPVRNLAAADFTILENGQPQEIVAFAPVDVPEPEPPTAEWMRDVSPDVRTNTLGDGRLFAIILDDATVPPDVRITADARRIARTVIDRLGPADLAAVIFVMNSRQSVDFTNDRSRLRAAVETFAPSFAYSDAGGPTDSTLFYSSIRTLGQVSSHLATVPHRRKAIVYVSTGAPVDLEAVTTMTLVGGRGLAPPLGAPIEGGTLDEETARDLMNAMADVLATQPQAAYGAAMQDAFLRAQHGNVNIYSVDPGGLGGLGAFLQTRVRRGIGLPMMTPAEAFQEARMHRDFLRTVADNSGGRAILDSNDLASGIAQIFRENSSYYLIGYRSTRAPADRTIRRVTVRVRQPGLTAHTRNAYYDPRTRPRRLPAAGSPGLREALAGILPNPDIAMRASVAPFLVPGRRETGLAVVLGVRHPPLPGDIGARATGTLELLTSAFTPTGDPRKTVRQTATIVGRAGATEEAEYDLLSQIELPPGRYQLRVAAHSPALGKSGSVYLEVHVPDFSKEDVSLSGILLGATPSPAAAPADAFAGVLPIVPTSQREFQRGSEVIVFFRVYQRGRSAARPIAVTVRVANDHDSVVARSTATLDAAQFRDGAADYQFRLPVDQLQTGQYLLTVEAALGGRVARRDVRFERR